MEPQDKPEIKKLTEKELNALYGRIEDRLTKEDANLVKSTIKFSLWIQSKIQEAGIQISKLRKLIFGSNNEKSDKNDDDVDKGTGGEV